ncbi:DNA traslocase ftsK [Hyphomicrobium sp. 1Nfss2.1]|uniref:hypothetical protein n=1 Tax=Hyphomicrobium sp. 1Nfss2.1 TaxID=3413936 RepID=UPI003C7E91E8
MTARSNAIIATAAFGCLLLAGCAEGSLGSTFNTGSIDPQKQAAAEQAEKSKQALCATLVSQIEALNNEGVSDKVAKAAAKKYKLKSGDLAKADELNKANTEFQSKCSSYPPRIAATAPVDPVTTGSVAAAGTTKTASKAKPPVPTQKPVAAAMAPQETTASAATTPAIPNP